MVEVGVGVELLCNDWSWEVEGVVVEDNAVLVLSICDRASYAQEVSTSDKKVYVMPIHREKTINWLAPPHFPKIRTKNILITDLVPR